MLRNQFFLATLSAVLATNAFADAEYDARALTRINEGQQLAQEGRAKQDQGKDLIEKGKKKMEDGKARPVPPGPPNSWCKNNVCSYPDDQFRWNAAHPAKPANTPLIQEGMTLKAQGEELVKKGIIDEKRGNDLVAEGKRMQKAAKVVGESAESKKMTAEAKAFIADGQAKAKEADYWIKVGKAMENAAQGGTFVNPFCSFYAIFLPLSIRHQLPDQNSSCGANTPPDPAKIQKGQEMQAKGHAMNQEGLALQQRGQALLAQAKTL